MPFLVKILFSLCWNTNSEKLPLSFFCFHSSWKFCQADNIINNYGVAVVVEWEGKENQAAVSQCRFSLWTSRTLTALRVLVWSKTHEHIFWAREKERGQRKNLILSPKLTPRTDPEPCSMSSHSVGPRAEKWTRLFRALLTAPCFISISRGDRDPLLAVSGVLFWSLKGCKQSNWKRKTYVLANITSCFIFLSFRNASGISYVYRRAIARGY